MPLHLSSQDGSGGLESGELRKLLADLQAPGDQEKLLDELVSTSGDARLAYMHAVSDTKDVLLL
jgi:hypothetical protein